MTDTLFPDLFAAPGPAVPDDAAAALRTFFHHMATFMINRA